MNEPSKHVGVDGGHTCLPLWAFLPMLASKGASRSPALGREPLKHLVGGPLPQVEGQRAVPVQGSPPPRRLAASQPLAPALGDPCNWQGQMLAERFGKLGDIVPLRFCLSLFKHDALEQKPDNLICIYLEF